VVEALQDGAGVIALSATSSLGWSVVGAALICARSSPRHQRAAIVVVSPSSAGCSARRDDDAGIEIDRVLGLVGKVRATVLHLGDLGLVDRSCWSTPRSTTSCPSVAIDANEIVRTRVSMPLSLAILVRHFAIGSAMSRRTIVRSAALASIVEASTPCACP